MKKEDLVDYILNNGKYLFTIRVEIFKINLYQINESYWEIHFNFTLNTVTRVGKVTEYGLKKYLPFINISPGL